MTDYLHHYNVVIDPGQGEQRPDGSWAREVTLVRARELAFELLIAAEHAQQTTADQDDAR